MSFKPGMHQIVNTEKAENPIDFNAIVQAMGKVKPQATLPTSGWGKKVVSRVEAKIHERIVVLEFFAEIFFDPEPEDPKAGFTRQDVHHFRGVNVLDVEPEPMDDGSGYHQSSGVMLSYDDFLEQYITDKGAKVLLDRLMDSMDEHVVVGDGIIEQVNGAWDNRSDRDYGLYKITIN